MKFLVILVMVLSIIGAGMTRDYLISKDELSKKKLEMIDNSTDALSLCLEKAYFEGQRNALQGRVDIEFNRKSNKYVWIRSPWNSGKKPIFIPNQSNNQGDVK